MKYKYKALVTAPPILSAIFSYKNLFDKNLVEIVVPPYKVHEHLNENQLIELLQNIDGILCGDDAITEKVIKRAKKLKVISKWGTGIDSIDITAATKKKIKVLRVKDAFSEPVSDTVLAYILLFARKIIAKDKFVRLNKWDKIESFTLKEKSLGIIGMGHIGQAVAKKALALGMTVFGNDDKNTANILSKSTDIKMLKLHELLKKSDFVTLHCDLNKSSYHLIGKNELKLMKKDSILINTSRGEVINQQDLEYSLINKEISGAALDVFEFEPLPRENILRKIDNVFLSPHNSNASPSVFEFVNKKSIDNLLLGICEKK